MNITLSQAQEAVGKGQDPQKLLKFLKENDVFEVKELPRRVRQLAEMIGPCAFNYIWGNEESAKFSPITNSSKRVLSKPHDGLVIQLRADYTFAPDCPKTAECANYESSCENFKPIGRTFTEAFLDMPYGSSFWIGNSGYVKGISGSGGEDAIYAQDHNGNAFFKKYHNSWSVYRLAFNPNSLTEAAISGSYKPEVE